MNPNRLFLGLSHSPLMGLNPVDPAVEAELQGAIARARELVRAFDPERVLLVAPDHYNGFFNEVMPPFCLGTQARSVGDYLTPPGELNVDADGAVALADRLMDAGFDLAVSRRMVVDHGFAQPLQLLWGGLDTPPVMPLFLNAVAAPGIPRLPRCRALGQAIGRALAGDPRRILLLGSGGLSHEPPVPTLADPDPSVRERITARQNPTPAEREAKTRRVMSAGMALASGNGAIKALNPAWDAEWMDGLSGDAAALDRLCAQGEDAIAQTAGRSAHESKSWLVARAALPGEAAPRCLLRHYQAIPEYIAGFGLLALQAAP